MGKKNLPRQLNPSHSDQGLGKLNNMQKPLHTDVIPLGASIALSTT